MMEIIVKLMTENGRIMQKLPPVNRCSSLILLYGSNWVVPERRLYLWS